MKSTIYSHLDPGDKFSAEISTESSAPYVVVKISSPFADRNFAMFTPNGINLSRDCLVELRDALNGAIAELEEMGAVKELSDADSK